MQKITITVKFISTSSSEGVKGPAKSDKTPINLYKKSRIGNNSTNLHSLTHLKTRLESCKEAKTITTNKTLKICPNENPQFTFKKLPLPSMRRYPLPKAQGTICTANWSSVKETKEKSMTNRI
jgi:hypothetical protein